MNLDTLMKGSRYVGYTYGYPHKTAYRAFETPLSLEHLWQTESVQSLFLYLHIPFCEMRCGFCNLFTRAVPDNQRVAQYLDALDRQMRAVSNVLTHARYARMAVGGGTPTWLTASQLETLLSRTQQWMGVDIERVPCSIETSPATATMDRIRVLRSHGIQRVSMGVQSFVSAERSALGRSSEEGEAQRGLERLRSAGFATVNVDLIYGIAGQTLKTLEYSLQQTLQFAPEEVFLYPLYVREHTGLWERGRRRLQTNAAPEDHARMEQYAFARELLLSSGYAQTSMRMFRRIDSSDTAGPAYCVQRDGMVGLGCGARSYTRAVHWSEPFAVSRGAIDAVIDDYLAHDEASFAWARYGITLDSTEQRIRYLLLTLLGEGLIRTDYIDRFGSDPMVDFPQLDDVCTHGLAHWQGDELSLTSQGIACSDVLGPWLYSSRVVDRMRGFELT